MHLGKTLQESPNIILARIVDALAPRAETEFDEALQKQLRDQIPAADLEEFDLALSDAREANRMRDEHGVYNDIWGVGVRSEDGTRLNSSHVVISYAVFCLKKKTIET